MARTISITVMLGIFFATALPLVPTVQAYAGKRIIYGTSNYYPYPRNGEMRYGKDAAYPSTHCVYFADNGRCQYTTTHYNNVRTSRVDLSEPYLYVDPVAVSPRARHTRKYYIRSENYYLHELPPLAYGVHYRKTHKLRLMRDDSRYSW